ncbi:hypothetical protein JCM16303_003006 [Sporobolomyces ruberrimus]
MPPTDSPNTASRNIPAFPSRVEGTNYLISLTNGPNPSSAVPLLSAALHDRTSFACSSPSFEALNRVTLAYALVRSSQPEAAKIELVQVGKMIEEDEGKTAYFAKVRKRAWNVVVKGEMGFIRGINDMDYKSNVLVSGSKLKRLPKRQTPLEPELMLDFADLSLEHGDEEEGKAGEGSGAKQEEAMKDEAKEDESMDV